ncbi:DUF3159 domain-containing protein [Mycobacterium sp. 050134]|uniref:DUF3159 domain-containing protein n=1 Tax=Mycobacterium sp. 050134 TaxID=3096111 RepID=UPI003FA52341
MAPDDWGAGPQPESGTTDRVTPDRLIAQLGGVSGVIYSSLPVVVFVAASSLSGLGPAIGAAMGVATLILLWRLIRRGSIQPAFSGFIGVAVCALIAYVVGASKGYFLLGIWMSLLWAMVFAASVVIRRPLAGYAWSWATGRDRAWRAVPRAVYAFDAASLCWVMVFTSRFIVQRLLYEADQTGWLGFARIAMGWPLTVMAALVTYAAIKAAQRAMAGADSAGFEADTASD